MARDASKNLQLSVSVEYNVYNWKLFEGQMAENIDLALQIYGEEVVKAVEEFVGVQNGTPLGPGPHPHRTGSTDAEGKDFNWWWDDTGALAESVEWRIKGRGFLRTVEIFNNPIMIDDRLVDYGTFLEVGWHPINPKSNKRNKFYAYPWLSVSLAKALPRAIKRIPKALTASLEALPAFQLFGKSRSEGGTGTTVQQNKFTVSENISADVKGYFASKTLGGWLAAVPGAKGIPRIPGIRTTKVQNRLLNDRDARNYARRSASYRNANPPPKKRPT